MRLSIRRTAGLLAGLTAGLLACATPGPTDTVGAYREAVASKDAAALWALTDHRGRARHQVADLAAAMAADPADLAALQAALATPSDAWQVTAVVAMPGGRQMLLALEGGAWRVASGGVTPATLDTPAGALAAFFAAVADRDWRRVRQVIPARHADRLAGDAALAAHLEAMADRIEAAKLGVGSGAVSIDGDRAVLSWGKGKLVRFEREAGRWTIVDLE